MPNEVSILEPHIAKIDNGIIYLEADQDKLLVKSTLYPNTTAGEILVDAESVKMRYIKVSGDITDLDRILFDNGTEILPVANYLQIKTDSNNYNFKNDGLYVSVSPLLINVNDVNSFSFGDLVNNNYKNLEMNGTSISWGLYTLTYSFDGILTWNGEFISDNITVNTTNIATNITNIGNNTTAIGINTTNITNLDALIATNAGNITLAENAINANTTLINTNTSGVGSNTFAISALQTADIDLEGLISTNTADILELQGESNHLTDATETYSMIGTTKMITTTSAGSVMGGTVSGSNSSFGTSTATVMQASQFKLSTDGTFKNNGGTNIFYYTDATNRLVFDSATKIEFWTGAKATLIIDSTKIEMNGTLDMNLNDMTEVHNITCNHIDTGTLGSGQIITTGITCTNLVASPLIIASNYITTPMVYTSSALTLQSGGNINLTGGYLRGSRGPMSIFSGISWMAIDVPYNAWNWMRVLSDNIGNIFDFSVVPFDCRIHSIIVHRDNDNSDTLDATMRIKNYAGTVIATFPKISTMPNVGAGYAELGTTVTLSKGSQYKLEGFYNHSTLEIIAQVQFEIMI